MGHPIQTQHFGTTAKPPCAWHQFSLSNLFIIEIQLVILFGGAARALKILIGHA